MSESRPEVTQVKITDVRVSPPIGPDVDLAIDLHARYNVADALRIAYEVEPFNLMWLEDPIPPGKRRTKKKPVRSWISWSPAIRRITRPASLGGSSAGHCWRGGTRPGCRRLPRTWRVPRSWPLKNWK